MNVLVIGNGGREHAIIWKLKQSPNIEKIYCTIGNAGINKIAEPVNIKPSDIISLIDLVKKNEIGFTVVGPEVPLAAGVVDEFKKNGLNIFGPTRAAARLENSKVFAKDFMMRHNIPTAQFRMFTLSEKQSALDFARSSKYPLVIKADGLAAGKGVIICENESDAAAAVKEIFEDKVFGSAGESIVIEEFLSGNEASVFAICDGENYVILPSSQDHKKIGCGETGKNTGGMGSYAPADKVVTKEVLAKVKERIIEPVIKKMKAEGNVFKGCLYAGLMIDSGGNPFVIEFNTRFGDPETQAVLPIVKSDLLEMFIASGSGNIADYKLELYNDFYVSVVMASSGYPDSYETGKEITGLDDADEDCIVFHSGTVEENGKVLTAGGRVLNVVGRSSESLKQAIDNAYDNIKRIHFENSYYRTDIGLKGIA